MTSGGPGSRGGSAAPGTASTPPAGTFLASLETPFARRFAIEDWFPFQLKRLRQYLRERNIGRVTIKKRGSPLDPAVLQRQLRLQGSEERILFLTFVLGEPAVLVGRID